MLHSSASWAASSFQECWSMRRLESVGRKGKRVISWLHMSFVNRKLEFASTVLSTVYSSCKQSKDKSTFKLPRALPVCFSFFLALSRTSSVAGGLPASKALRSTGGRKHRNGRLQLVASAPSPPQVAAQLRLEWASRPPTAFASVATSSVSRTSFRARMRLRVFDAFHILAVASAL